MRERSDLRRPRPSPASFCSRRRGHRLGRRGTGRSAGTRRPGHLPPRQVAGSSPPRHLRRQRPARGSPVVAVRQLDGDRLEPAPFDPAGRSAGNSPDVPQRALTTAAATGTTAERERPPTAYHCAPEPRRPPAAPTRGITRSALPQWTVRCSATPSPSNPGPERSSRPRTTGTEACSSSRCTPRHRQPTARQHPTRNARARRARRHTTRPGAAPTGDAGPHSGWPGEVSAIITAEVSANRRSRIRSSSRLPIRSGARVCSIRSWKTQRALGWGSGGTGTELTEIPRPLTCGMPGCRRE